MRLPRDLSGKELVRLLRRYGYAPSRQSGSHLQLVSTAKGPEHHVTIPQRSPLKVGTLAAILARVAAYLERDREEVAEELFR